MCELTTDMLRTSERSISSCGLCRRTQLYFSVVALSKIALLRLGSHGVSWDYANSILGRIRCTVCLFSLCHFADHHTVFNTPSRTAGCIYFALYSYWYSSAICSLFWSKGCCEIARARFKPTHARQLNAATCLYLFYGSVTCPCGADRDAVCRKFWPNWYLANSTLWADRLFLYMETTIAV